MINISELRNRIEQHLGDFAHQMDANAVGCVRTFADWLEGKQTEDAEAEQHIRWLTEHGYTVTKAQAPTV